MAKYHNDFIIDKLTNSITNSISGDSFPTDVSLLSNLNSMKSKKQELYIDFIQSRPLTEAEETALSEYIKQLKNKKKKSHSKKAA